MVFSPWGDTSSLIEALLGSGRPSCQILAPPPQPPVRMPGDWPGSELFFAYEFEDSDFQQALGQHLLELSVLSLQILQLFCLVDFHLPKLLLPSMEAHFREVVLATHLPNALAGVRLPQYPNLVLCAVSLSFHGLWGWLTQRLTHHLAQITEVTSGAVQVVGHGGGDGDEVVRILHLIS